jgi:hypothetical protein
MDIVKKLILISSFLIFFAASISLTKALIIKLTVAPRIEGNLNFFNFSNEIPISNLQVYWENTGSVGCKVRARAEFFREDELKYVAWSQAKEVWPGALAVLNSFVTLPEGNYSFHLFIHHCYLTFDKGWYNITFTNSYLGSGIEVKFFKTFKNNLELKIKNNADKVENLVIIPTSYPFGWIFESAIIEEIEKGEEKTVRINYEPSIWQEENVTLVIGNLEGKVFLEKTFEMKLEKSFFEKFYEFIESIFKSNWLKI